MLRKLYAGYLELMGCTVPKEVYAPVCEFLGGYFKELGEAFGQMPELFQPQVEIVRQDGILALFKLKLQVCQELLEDMVLTPQIRIVFK
jgi:hypothetical protein